MKKNDLKKNSFKGIETLKQFLLGSDALNMPNVYDIVYTFGVWVNIKVLDNS